LWDEKECCNSTGAGSYRASCLWRDRTEQVEPTLAESENCFMADTHMIKPLTAETVAAKAPTL